MTLDPLSLGLALALLFSLITTGLSWRRLALARQAASTLQQRLDQLQAQEQQQGQQLVQLKTRLQAELQRGGELREVLGERERALEAGRQRETRLVQQLSELKTRLDEQQRQAQQAQQLLEDNKAVMKQEFQVLANEILDAKGKAFSQQQKERLEHLLSPFKEQLNDFRSKVESARREESEGRAALREQLTQLFNLNQQITSEAANLTQALKGDKKLQGNWGELHVERILESSGLIKGSEYEREPNFKDEEGNNRRPDFIVHLPEGKHLIIDSKVSLNDYLAYVQAEDEVSRQGALNRHIQAVRNHIRGLSDKDYPRLKGMQAPDFVFLFMPIEPAFLAAFQHDQQLFNEAFERRIVVVTPSTLLATLRTVANLWTIERQNANARKLADRAAKVHDKLRVFVEKMEKLDGQLVGARKSYDEAMNTLKHGTGNLISQARQFEALGVRVKKELPRQTLGTADLDEQGLDEDSELLAASQD
ncbi:DNA recombination protein RmuC [Gallaecimonas sp. GXIMD4217]|uniref:DNA recombination protein RmuC n=1 Tax=Gallaecimonas sp. GXIMD4217 TaxID=3131927 RepID=UPI00311B1E8D